MCYNVFVLLCGFKFLLKIYVLEGKKLAIREELDAFIERSDEFIDSKYILADIKLVNLLKAIASSETILALFKNCLTDFDYNEAQKKYLVKSRYLSDEKGEFILPPNSRELLAFIFNVLVDIDSKRIDLNAFISKYFYVDGSFSSGYDAFITGMIKPFKNTVKMLIESVLDGKLQDPVEAFTEEEERRAKQKEIDKITQEKERELLKKAYGQSVKEIKRILLEDKQKVKNSKLKPEVAEEITLVIDMLANVIDSEDKDAVCYAFVTYKYVTKAHKILFFGRLRKISKYLKDVLNEI